VITCGLLALIATTDPIIFLNILAGCLVRVLACYLSYVVNNVYVVIDYLGLINLLEMLLHYNVLNVSLVNYLELSVARVLYSLILWSAWFLVHRVVRSSSSLFAG